VIRLKDVKRPGITRRFVVNELIATGVGTMAGEYVVLSDGGVATLRSGAVTLSSTTARVVQPAIARSLADFPALLRCIDEAQPYVVFDDCNRPMTEMWLSASHNIVNDTKHVQLPQHNATSKLNERAKGLIEVRDTTILIDVRSGYPELKMWSLWPRLIGLGSRGAVLSEQHRRALSRAARALLANHPTIVAGNLTYLTSQQQSGMPESAFIVTGEAKAVADAGDDALRQRLKDDLGRFETSVNNSAAVNAPKAEFDGDDVLRDRFIEVLLEFVKRRLEWQNSAVRIRDVQPDEKADLLQLGHRALLETQRIVLECAKVVDVCAKEKGDASPFVDGSKWQRFDWCGGAATLNVDDVLNELAAPNDVVQRHAMLLAEVHRHARAIDDLPKQARLWSKAGDAADVGAKLNVDGSSTRLSLKAMARHCWQQCSDILDFHAHDRDEVELRLRALEYTWQSCVDDGLLEEALFVEQIHDDERRLYLPHVATLDVSNNWRKRQRWLDGDTFAQLEHVKSQAQSLLLGGLRLLAGVDHIDGTSNERALLAELTLEATTALIKCRNVLDHVWGRFVRAALSFAKVIISYFC
jgi:hypothetical protein